MKCIESLTNTSHCFFELVIPGERGGGGGGVGGREGGKGGSEKKRETAGKIVKSMYIPFTCAHQIPLFLLFGGNY